MTDRLIDEAPEGVNTPEYSVSELSGAVKRMVEGGFAHVRVRGEVGRVSRPRSGHVYLDLKDERAVLAGVIWKGTAARLEIQPQEGDEVIATGRLTTFPGQSKYQIVIESLAHAGAGALLAKLERLKQALAAEGLFATERKRAIPYLPRTIGVVTSPSGAVIRDILHRLAERFPVHVLVWPVAVQGAASAGEVAAAIRGFGALAPGGPIPRPDVLIVARGGGSVEDLWGFNDEAVVRAAAASPIPLISAVGHETDTTLIDLAADRRAPTPSAAAEMAVPVRADLAAALAELDARRIRAEARRIALSRQRLGDLGRALPRPASLIETRQQRLDWLAARLPAPERLTAHRRQRLADLAARLPRPGDLVAHRRERLTGAARRLPLGLLNAARHHRGRLDRAAAGLRPRLVVEPIAAGRRESARLGARLAPLLARHVAARRERLDALARLLGSLGYRRTLARGYAVVRDDAGTVLTRAAPLGPGRAVEIEFADGRVDAVTGAPRRGRAAKPRTDPDTPQGSLF